MNSTDILKNNLVKLEGQINQRGYAIRFHQQDVKKENMSFSGGDGRICIQPFHEQYDISLSGKALTKNMSKYMRNLCEKECDGYKQKNTKIGKCDQPYWRVSQFSVVEDAVQYYAKTKK